MVALNISIKTGLDGTQITLKAHEKLEAFMRSLSTETPKISQNWLDTENRPMAYYEITDEMTAQLSDWLSRNSATNSVGVRLMEYERINIGILRLIGISKGLSVHISPNHLANNLEAEEYVRKLADIVKSMFATFIHKKQVKATITITI